MALSPLNRRRWRNFRANGRAFWSLWIFGILFVISLFAEFVANDKPILVSYRGDLYVPVLKFYPETAFGGDFQTEAVYSDPAIQCLIKTGGMEACWDDPEGVAAQAATTGAVDGEAVNKGWIVWPPIPYSYTTINNVGIAPSAPDGKHWLGTDDTSRDVLARIIYGFRLSVLFALLVSSVASVIGIAPRRLRSRTAWRRQRWMGSPLAWGFCWRWYCWARCGRRWGRGRCSRRQICCSGNSARV